MLSQFLESLRARLLTSSTNPQVTTQDGQTLSNGLFQSLEVKDTPAVVLANDGSQLLNRGLITTNNAPAAVQAQGENVDIFNSRSGRIEANNGSEVPATGVQVQGSASIRNAGKITGDFNGVQFAGPDSSGSLENSRNGVISSDSRALDIQGQGIEIRNAGQILGTGDQRSGTVFADGTADDYQIVNERTGLIDAGAGNNGSGISLQTGSEDGDVVDASVINRGVIRGRGDTEGENGELVGHGIRVFSGLGPNEDGDIAGTVTFRGNIENYGEITAEEGIGLANGISIDEGVSFLGDIVNHGLIDSRDSNAIEVGPRGRFTGDIRNDGTLAADDDGILLNGSTVFSGNIVNQGRIEAGDEGIDVGSNNSFSGNIVNRGSIAAADDGIEISRDSTFTGDIVNKGRVEAGDGDLDNGIVVEAGVSFEGNIVNRGGIVAGDDGIEVLADATFTGNIVNGGSIDVTSQEDGPDRQAGIALEGVSAFTGGLVNQHDGRIEASDQAIVVDSASFTGDIVNQGRIEAGSDGILIEENSNTFTGDIRNEGTLSAGSDGILLDSGNTFIGDIVNLRGATIAGDGDAIEINDVDAFDGTIRNAGTLTGDADGSGTGDAIDVESANVDIAVVNTGTINGDVELGSGNDVFDSSRGIVNGNVEGNDGNDVLIGGVGDDRLDGGTGDDFLTGGSGADIFVFEEDTANDTVSDFEVSYDQLEVGVFFADAAEALAAARQDGDDTVIDLSAADSVRLIGVNSADLTEGDLLI